MAEARPSPAGKQRAEPGFLGQPWLHYPQLFPSLTALVARHGGACPATGSPRQTAVDGGRISAVLGGLGELVSWALARCLRGLQSCKAGSRHQCLHPGHRAHSASNAAVRVAHYELRAIVAGSAGESHVYDPDAPAIGRGVGGAAHRRAAFRRLAGMPRPGWFTTMTVVAFTTWSRALSPCASPSATARASRNRAGSTR